MWESYTPTTVWTHEARESQILKSEARRVPTHFFLQQSELHNILLLTFKSIWHPMKQLFSSLHIKTPGYTGMSTPSPYHHLAQHTDNHRAAQFMICTFLQTLATVLWRSSFIFHLRTSESWHMENGITIPCERSASSKGIKHYSCFHFWKNWPLNYLKSLLRAFLPCSVSHVTYLYYLAQSVSKLERNK
jgi:hypothetical protein